MNSALSSQSRLDRESPHSASAPRWGSLVARSFFAASATLLLTAAPLGAAPGDLNDDGVPDLFEGLLPAASGSVELPTLSHNPAGGSAFTFRRIDSSLASGLTVSVEWSDDLENWEPILIEETSTPDVDIQDNGSEPDLIQVTLPDLAGDTQLFARLSLVESGDTTPPVITPPDNIFLEATGPGGAVATFSATATDAVSGTITPTFSTDSGSTFPIGTTPVLVSATDAAGNLAQVGFNVTVRDTTLPVITAPNIIVEAADPVSTVAILSATATDLVSGTLTPSYDPLDNSFPLGTHTVNVSATDTAGNTATATFTVTVRDTTPPVITPPDNITLDATGPETGAVANFSATATDVVSGSITPTFSTPSGSTFPIGDTTVTVSATDAAGNTGTASFTVTVTLPIFDPQATIATYSSPTDPFSSSFIVQTLSLGFGLVSVTADIAPNVPATVTSQTNAIGLDTITLAQADSGLGAGGAVITLEAPAVAAIVAASNIDTGTSAITGAGLQGTNSPSAAIATLATSPAVQNVTVLTPSGVSVTIGAALNNLSAALVGGDAVILPTALNDAVIAVLTAQRANPGNAELRTTVRALDALYKALQPTN